ncbi:MAG: MarR family winged helix-turn-helix transcriptional regulator [Hyphomicrobiaceae bacterium]
MDVAKAAMRAEMGLPAARGRRRPGLDLQHFFPYQLAVLADAVSTALSQIYAERFDLTRPEWRILATLGSGGGIRAREIGRLTTLDKMQVSRAVQRLERRGLIARKDDADDRRNKRVRLTRAGRSLYDQIVPLVQEREKAILADLSADDRATLDRIIAGLLARSRSFHGCR